ncbi:hypothetical protein DFH08DRAFT_851763 [Mycena albidolilacea]|uniref:Uncharacterized protein n=1 Tax=Mycena albidolilacea TaxID=1033008 RepID=A0AAD7AFW7_9AGAR|nr:hypothetical protein DFH08DRAFT_851763 [Mycena albidolilacea]
MAVVAPFPSLSTLDKPIDVSPVSFVELGPPRDAVELFKQLILQSHTPSLRLYCTVPTWCPTSENCLDLHDLHEMRTKFLVFIHDLVQALRSSGIATSYVLVPSSSSRCILSAGGSAAMVDILQKTTLPVDTRQAVLLADLGCPCLVFK